MDDSEERLVKHEKILLTVGDAIGHVDNALRIMKNVMKAKPTDVSGVFTDGFGAYTTAIDKLKEMRDLFY
jgi:hypothetical protein